MPGAISTRKILDGQANPIDGRFFDVSGTGAGPWVPVSVLHDPNSGAIGTIKPASTAPVASDPALVVAISPNGQLPAGQSTMNTSTPVVLASDQSWPVSTVGFMKKEDVPSADGDAGIPAMAVRKATPADTSTADGDYEFLSVKDGRLLTSRDDSVLYSGTAQLSPLRASISASASGATTIVTSTAGKKIRVLQWDVKVNAAVNFKWQSKTTPTDLTGLYYCSGQGDGMARAYSPLGHFETVTGESLDINLSSAVAVGGVLTYVLV